MRHLGVAGLTLLLVLTALAGCAKTARDTTGYAAVDKAKVALPYDRAWQAAKDALVELDLDIYTRDKRGVFVAYTSERNKGPKLFRPKRFQLMVLLEPVSENETAVTVETIQQVYGVTLLTYPGWHDRKTSDHARAQKLLALMTQTAATGAQAAGDDAEDSTPAAS